MEAGWNGAGRAGWDGGLGVEEMNGVSGRWGMAVDVRTLTQHSRSHQIDV